MSRITRLQVQFFHVENTVEARVKITTTSKFCSWGWSPEKQWYVYVWSINCDIYFQLFQVLYVHEYFRFVTCIGDTPRKCNEACPIGSFIPMFEMYSRFVVYSVSMILSKHGCCDTGDSLFGPDSGTTIFDRDQMISLDYLPLKSIGGWNLRVSSILRRTTPLNFHKRSSSPNQVYPKPTVDGRHSHLKECILDVMCITKL